jgi:inhibitor of cysteine peptidase
VGFAKECFLRVVQMKGPSRFLERSLLFWVTLCSNPTTGFQWPEKAQISDTTVLEQKDHKFIGPESEAPPPPGTPGQEVWTFKTLKEGSSTIFFEYSRPWEGGEKGEWILTVDVIVK